MSYFKGHDLTKTVDSQYTHDERHLHHEISDCTSTYHFPGISLDPTVHDHQCQPFLAFSGEWSHQKEKKVHNEAQFIPF